MKFVLGESPIRPTGLSFFPASHLLRMEAPKLSGSMGMRCSPCGGSETKYAEEKETTTIWKAQDEAKTGYCRESEKDFVAEVSWNDLVTWIKVPTRNAAWILRHSRRPFSILTFTPVQPDRA